MSSSTTHDTNNDLPLETENHHDNDGTVITVDKEESNNNVSTPSDEIANPVEGGDNSDARFTTLINTVTRRVEVRVASDQVLKIPHNSLDYAMNGVRRGKCIIINNRVFDSRTNLNTRNGTEVDGKALAECFHNLDFDVELLEDKTYREIYARLLDVGRSDHSQNDCLVVSILSHGDRGCLWARDNKYAVDDVYQHFTGDKCPSLAGKPKLFFIQACQGDQFDRGCNVVHQDVVDGATYHKIPTWYATITCLYKYVLTAF